jgi:hypothetical protein
MKAKNNQAKYDRFQISISVVYACNNVKTHVNSSVLRKSRPIVGSSRIRSLSPLKAARKTDSRFCRPPDNFPTALVGWISSRPTLSSKTSISGGASRRGEASSKFSETDNVSNNPDFWNATPSPNRTSGFPRTVTPSKRITPADKRISHRMHP